MHKDFKEGREYVEDNLRSGRPISSTNNQNVETVPAVIVKARRMSVRVTARQTVLQRCLGTTLETGPASPNGHCRLQGASP